MAFKHKKCSNLRVAGPKARRPSDVQQCGAAADQGRQAAGPSEQRAAERSACLRQEAPKEKGLLPYFGKKAFGY